MSTVDITAIFIFDLWLIVSWCQLLTFDDNSTFLPNGLCLKDTDHIYGHLAEKTNKLESYKSYTLANNLDVKCLTFLDTVWQKAVLPALAHGAGVCFNDTAKAKQWLPSFQYKCGKEILKIHCMPAKIATLCSLGWLPGKDSNTGQSGLVASINTGQSGLVANINTGWSGLVASINTGQSGLVASINTGRSGWLPVLTLGGRGWLPVLDHLDTLWVRCFSHLCQMEDNRATKVIFNKLWEQFSNNDIETCRYLSNVKDIFTPMGMDHLFAKDTNINVPAFKERVTRSHQIQFTQDLDNYNSYSYTS